MLIARISWHLHIFINITHFTKIPMWKLFMITPMEKSKAEKSPWVKKMKITGPKKKEKAPFCQAKKKTLPQATRLLVWPNAFDKLSICWRSGAFNNHFGMLFVFTFGIFAHYYEVVLNWTALSEIKNVLQCDAFPGKSWSIVIDTRGPVFPLVCCFIRRDNILAWCELFTNLTKLKSRIWFLEEYIHFERIYRVFRFDGLSWNFARTFQR